MSPAHGWKNYYKNHHTTWSIYLVQCKQVDFTFSLPQTVQDKYTHASTDICHLTISLPISDNGQAWDTKSADPTKTKLLTYHMLWVRFYTNYPVCLMQQPELSEDWAFSHCEVMARIMSLKQSLHLRSSTCSHALWKFLPPSFSQSVSQSVRVILID